jgi:hypothetical protein
MGRDQNRCPVGRTEFGVGGLTIVAAVTRGAGPGDTSDHTR